MDVLLASYLAKISIADIADREGLGFQRSKQTVQNPNRVETKSLCFLSHLNDRLRTCGWSEVRKSYAELHDNSTVSIDAGKSYAMTIPRTFFP